MANVERGVIRRVAVVVLPVLLGLSLLVPAQVSALDFNWSFFDEGFFSGTVVGLPLDGVGVAATDVVITSDGSLSFVVPEDTIDGDVLFNEWTVVNGVITSVNYVSQNFDVNFPFAGDELQLFNDGGGFSGLLHDGLFDQTRSGPVTFSAVGVPEPGTLTLLGLGLAGLACFRPRRFLSRISSYGAAN